MRSVWLKNQAVILLLVFCAASAAAQTNPHTQIRWPANCDDNNFMVYNFTLNACIDMSQLNPSTQIVWPPSCSTPNTVYIPSAGTCVLNGSGTTGIPLTTAMLKGSGLGTALAAVPGTDYAAPMPATTALLKGNNAGGAAAATAGTDYVVPTGSVASLNAPSALPNLTTATTQSQGDNSTSVATDQFVNQQIAAGGTIVPGAQAIYYAYRDGTGTTLTDRSGNGYNCTFASGTNAPTWALGGAAINFNASVAAQYITCPPQVLQNAGTIMIWFAPVIPAYNDSALNQYSTLLSDSATHVVSMTPSRFGTVSFGGATGYEAIDRINGNASWSVVCSGGANATPAIYINGHSPIGIFNSAGSACPSWATSGNVIIGCTNLIGNCAAMNFYAMVIYPQSVAMSADTIAQTDGSVRYLLTHHGVSGVVESKFPGVLYAQGDSRTINYSTNQLIASRPWFWSALEPGREQYYNWGVSSRTLSSIIGAMPSVEYPTLNGNQSTFKVGLLDAGTNDIRLNSATGAQVFASVQQYCYNLHQNAPGTKIVYATSMARSDNTTANETSRETLNQTVLAAWLGKTLECDSVDDLANDPVVATQITPNNFQPTAAGSFNTQWTADGIHPNQTMNSETSTGESVSLLDAQGRLNSCKVIRKQVPYQVLTAANLGTPSTSQSIPLIQLGPGWQVCSLLVNVAQPFAGTSISAATVSIGDSTGTATQYLPTQTLLTAGTQQMGANTYTSPTGVVQMNISATGGNLTAFTTGNLTVDIGVRAGAYQIPGVPPTVGGLIAWYKADALVSQYALANGNNVTVWPDSSGNGNALVPLSSGFPTLTTNAVNSQPVVHFAGDTTRMVGRKWIGTAQPYTVFTVFHHATSYSAFVLYASVASNQFFRNSTIAQITQGTSANGTIANDNAYHLVQTLWNGASSAMFDGSAQTTVSLSGTIGAGAWTSAAGIYIAGASGTGFGMTGDIAEIVIYSGALSTSDRGKVTTYLATKYAIP